MKAFYKIELTTIKTGGIRYIGAKISRGDGEIQPAFQRRANAFTKTLFAKFVGTLVEAGLAAPSGGPAVANAYVIGKPKHIEGLMQVKTLADLQDPRCDATTLHERFR